MPLRFSANLGMLWTELALPDAIRAAAKAGFEAVEFQCPYTTDAATIKAVLKDTGIPALNLNTEHGTTFGNAALSDNILEARAAIDAAIIYAAEIGARKIHVLTGVTSDVFAHETFLDNLLYALEQTENHNLTLLIEPINRRDIPGYFLHSASQAATIISEISDPNLQLMFDCYHMQISEGEVAPLLEKMLPIIGHIQVASVPDRHEPDEGVLDYRHIFEHIQTIGYTGYIGAEYRPRGTTESGLGWMKTLTV